MKTQSRLLQVAFAIFAGAFIGSVVGVRYFEQSFFSLVIGLIAGGAVGYLAYDPKKVWNGIIHAISETVSDIASINVKKEITLMRLRLRFFRRQYFEFLPFSIVLFWPVTLTAIAMGRVAGDMVLVAAAFYTSLLVMPFICSSMMVMDSFGDKKSFMYARKISLNRIGSFLPMRYLNPVSLPFVVLYWAGKGIVSGIVIGIISCYELLSEYGPHLAVTFFKFIHCELRVQTATYAMIGTVVGWSANSPIIGASVGTILGIVGYKLITVRLLKPVPVDA